MLNRVRFLVLLMFFCAASQMVLGIDYSVFPQFLLKNQTGKDIRVTVMVNTGAAPLESLVPDDSNLQLPDPNQISSISVKIVEGLSPHFTHEVDQVTIEKAVNTWRKDRRVTLNVFRDSIGPIKKGFKYTIGFESKDL